MYIELFRFSGGTCRSVCTIFSGDICSCAFLPCIGFFKRSYFACNFHCLSVVTESMHFLKVTMTQNTLELFVFEWQDGRINCSAVHIKYQWIMDYWPLLLVIIRCEIENIWLWSRKCACHRMQYSLSFLCFFWCKEFIKEARSRWLIPFNPASNVKIFVSDYCLSSSHLALK